MKKHYIEDDQILIEDDNEVFHRPIRIKRHFTHWIIPKNVITLFEDDVIGKSEMLLLADIHALQAEDGPFKGWCFATNNWLAKKHKVTRRQIQKMLSLLLKQKLLRKKTIRRFRCLRPMNKSS